MHEAMQATQPQPGNTQSMAVANLLPTMAVEKSSRKLQTLHRIVGVAMTVGTGIHAC